MVWDFAESGVLGGATGSVGLCLSTIVDVIEQLVLVQRGTGPERRLLDDDDHSTAA
jgi:hypothetical protein